MLLINTLGWLLIVSSVCALVSVALAVFCKDPEDRLLDEVPDQEDLTSGVSCAVLIIMLFLAAGVTLTRL